jgi:hypothetical protein
MTVTFEYDKIGARLIPEDWAYLRETAILGVDYPHTQGVWPNVDGAMEEMFAGVEPALLRAVVFDRAAKVFKIKLPTAAG